MAITKEQIDTIYERLDDLDDEIKELKELQKEAIQLFGEQNDVSVKAIKKGWRAHKELKKNKEEFELVDLEVSQIVDLLTDEPVTTETEGE